MPSFAPHGTAAAARPAPRPRREDTAAPGRAVPRSAGQPLALARLAFYSRRFRHDLSDVRVHSGPEAAAAAHAFGAEAYAVGRHVVLGENAANDDGVMAHELAHVVQQRGAGDAASTGTPPSSTPEAERAAEAAAGAIAGGGDAPPQPRQPLQLGRVKAATGTSDRFPANTQTKALADWDYVVYRHEVRLGNRVADKNKNVIGSWPWLTNNPGDLTGDLTPRNTAKKGEEPFLRQERRVWGQKTQYTTKGRTWEDPGSKPLSPGNTAVPGKTARTDLAIFEDRDTGRRALKEWIQLNYADMTLAESARKHLGSPTDDPEKYPVLMQLLLSERGYPATFVKTTKGRDIPDGDAKKWDDVVDAYGFAEGYLKRHESGGKVQFLENAGIVYTCGGRDTSVKVHPTYETHALVTAMPSPTPPEVSALLDCKPKDPGQHRRR